MSMTFTRQQMYLSQAAVSLGIHHELNHEVRLSNAERIVVPTFISNVGGVSGNLIFVEMPDADMVNQLIALGYGITAYDEPLDNENFDLASYKEMFEEWGWTGSVTANPFG